jgi:hypothetical protein
MVPEEAAALPSPRLLGYIHDIRDLAKRTDSVTNSLTSPREGEHSFEMEVVFWECVRRKLLKTHSITFFSLHRRRLLAELLHFPLLIFWFSQNFFVNTFTILEVC